MIITTVTHRRKRRSGPALVRHLMKVENEHICLEEIGNCLAETLSEAIAVMELYRDASQSKAGLHHCTINPSHEHSHGKLIEAVHRVRRELDPSGSRPYGIVSHCKPRAEPGGARQHFHLVLSHVDAAGAALDDGWIKIKTERLARELEHDLGEPAVLGRHHVSVLRRLRQDRPDVAIWLENSLGANPAKPQSAFSSAARGRARKQNLDLPKAKAAVRVAWSSANSFVEFRDNLTKLGFRLIAGEKQNVWVIVDKKGRLIGSANRLLKVRRQEFLSAMDANHAPHPRSEQLAFDSCSRSPTPRSGQSNRETIGGASATAEAADTRVDSRRGPGCTDFGIVGTDRTESSSERGTSWKYQPEARPAIAKLAQRSALIRLRCIDVARLKVLISLAARDGAIGSSEQRNHHQQVHLVPRTDIWGVGILPKPYR
jgi:hypothetical protein